jgi:hypothetical protein
MAKKFLVTAATADEQVKQNIISSLYDEEVILSSDYAKFASIGLYESRYVVDYIESIEGRKSEWVTTITRIA